MNYNEKESDYFKFPVGQEGTKIWLAKNDLMRLDSSSIDYPFTVKLIEIFTPKHMILNNMPTVAGGQILVSGGEIYLKVFKDNEELFQKPGTSYWFEVSGSDLTAEMEVFFGFDNGSYIDWTNDISVVNSTPDIDSLVGMFANPEMQEAYFVISPQYGWINCDYFYSSNAAKTTVSFQSDTDNLTNIDKFLVFREINSVMRVYDNVSEQIPIGMEAVVVCFAAGSNNDLYLYTEDITVVANHVENVTMAACSESDIISFLEGL